jgi:hypothetical protein
MESALEWHELSERALNNGLGADGLVNSHYVPALMEKMPMVEFKRLELREEMISQALDALGKTFSLKAGNEKR